MDLYTYERQATQQGYQVICGCDEAGAGPLAGPVYAAAVILPVGTEIAQLDDSKKLTDKKRRALVPMIKDYATAWAVAKIDAAEIDETDILSARIKAMQMAIDTLSIKADFALVDGNREKGRHASLKTAHMLLVHGDGLSASIAAASILAKVARDDEMVLLDAIYPEYGFAKHKGYGTKQHFEAISKFGMCPIHRRSFLTRL